MYQNYIFDLYGTLVDIHTEEENPLVWEKLALFLGYRGAGYTPRELEDAYQRLVRSQQIESDNAGEAAKSRSDSHEGYPEIQIEQVFERLYTEKGILPDFQLVLCTGQFFRVLTTEYIRLYEGVEEMLEELRRKKKGVYLLSNAQKIFTEYELRLLGIARYFDGILISSEHRVKKPDRRFFQILLKTYSLNPEECIMIGNDALCDIEGAKQTGMNTYYIHSNISPRGERDVRADYVQMEMDMGRVRRTLGI